MSILIEHKGISYTENDIILLLNFFTPSFEITKIQNVFIDTFIKRVHSNYEFTIHYFVSFSKSMMERNISVKNLQEFHVYKRNMYIDNLLDES